MLPPGNIQRRMPKTQRTRNMSKIIPLTLDHVKQGNTTKLNERLEDSEPLSSLPTPLRQKKKASNSEVKSTVRSYTRSATTEYTPQAEITAEVAGGTTDQAYFVHARVHVRLYVCFFSLKSRYDKTCCVTIYAGAPENDIPNMSVLWHTMRIVKGVSVLPHRSTRSSCAASSTLRSNMFALTATKVEDLHVRGMCSSSTSSSNKSEAAAEVEDVRGGGMCSSCASGANTSAAATHVKGVRAAENLRAMASARTWCDEKAPCFYSCQVWAKFPLNTCHMHWFLWSVFRASLETLTAHSSHHCPQPRENASIRHSTQSV